MLEKILLIVLVVLQVVGLWRGNQVIVQSENTENLTVQDIRNILDELIPEEREINKEVENQPHVVRGEFADYMQAGRDKEIYFNGDLYKLGGVCEYGFIQQIEKDFIKVVDYDGKITWLLPRSAGSTRITVNAATPPTHPASL